MKKITLLFTLLLLAMWISPLSFATAVAKVMAAPATVDLHDYWDQRCASCHGHAASFARHFLRIENDVLMGAHHQGNLAVFLRNHYLSDALVAPVSAMLKAQVLSQPLFNDKCASCHGKASAFARQSLRMQDGVLVTAADGRRVADYLATHGRLQAHEIPILVESLKRVRTEVASPAQ